MEYIAFLLGINVGGRTVKMIELTAMMESMGYKNVQAYLASGNVRFSMEKMAPDALVKKLETALEKKFGFQVGVIVRTVGELEKIHKANPFKGVKVTPQTRLYVTFLSEKPLAPLKAGKMTKEFAILKVTPGEVFSVLELSPKMGTTDVMKILNQSFGKRITTRNWNTIEKMLGV